MSLRTLAMIVVLAPAIHHPRSDTGLRPGPRHARFAAGGENGDSSAPSAAPVPVFTKENPPPTPKLEDLALKKSLTQYASPGPSRTARVGQFINGDWYVVGPVTVKAIDPKPLWARRSGRPPWQDGGLLQAPVRRRNGLDAQTCRPSCGAQQR